MNNDWLDIDVLEDYLDGKLDAKGMHFVERQALEDPFVAEALEGLKQSPKRKQTLSILQKQLYDRVTQKPVKRKLWGITTQRLSIAATATVAFIAVSILFFMRETNRRNAETVARKADGVVVNLDTNAPLAATTTKTKDSAININEATKSALIDQVIANGKSGALAKNTKSAPIVKTSESAVQTEQATANYQRFSKSRQSIALGAPKMKTSQEPMSEAMVSATPSTTTNQIVFSGNVIDQRNGQPVQGAVVKITGSDKITATNANGYFALPADSNSKDKDLVINALGFKETPVKGTQNPDAIREALSGNKSLNEIAMITGSNGRKKENIPAPKIVLRAEQNLNGKQADEISKPIPVAIIDYTQYLANNNKLYNPKGPEQFVILGFKVKKNGRPTNIKVIKSLNVKADAEAKRLIKDGPDWVLPTKGTNEVELSIRF
ncbi:carboxypeptidase-like regulatory domain-containing protein [Pedobacter sp. N23S346]|uniref:carboxypeptidase-like regulatory domain-containing protein n=1 Tax=Pedobacter sp. N23S346 TaxID=3402750 RepID=UPI003AC4CCF3